MFDGANLWADLEAEPSCFLFWLRTLPRSNGISEVCVPCCASNLMSGSDPTFAAPWPHSLWSFHTPQALDRGCSWAEEPGGSASSLPNPLCPLVQPPPFPSCACFVVSLVSKPKGQLLFSGHVTLKTRVLTSSPLPMTGPQFSISSPANWTQRRPFHRVGTKAEGGSDSSYCTMATRSASVNINWLSFFLPRGGTCLHGELQLQESAQL